MTTHKPAGTYALDEFSIETFTSDTSQQSFDPRTGFSTGSSQPITVDIKAIVHVWNIVESMKSGNVYGSATIYDSVGAFYDMPMRGQEVLSVAYTDLLGSSKKEKYFVYAISDVKPSKSTDDSTLEYKIHFVSFGKFWSDRYDIQRCIADGNGLTRQYIPISQQVQVIFDDYYSNPGGTLKPIHISDTDGEQKLVIPNLKPEDAMHMLSRKGYSGQYASCNYRFFESRDSYHFANVEELLDAATVVRDLEYNSGPVDQSPQGEINKHNSIVEIDYGQTVNTMEALGSGAYNRKYVELDPLTRTQSEYRYQHKDEFQKYIYPDGRGTNLTLQASDEMVDNHLNKWKYVYGIKDYPDADVNGSYGLRPHTYYGDIYNAKMATSYHLQQSSITVEVYGSNDVVAGSVVNIQIPQFRVQLDEDVQRSGKWLVESVINNFVEHTYYQTLTLVKGGLST